MATAPRTILVTALFVLACASALSDTRGPSQPGASYVLGPDDQLVVRGVGIEEIADKPMQVGQDGLVTLPMVGAVRAGGLTVRQFEAALTSRLGEVIRHPQVSVFVTEFRSQPVSVLGAVNQAGVVQLKGSKTLTEVLSLAGGVRQDAGYRVKIVRKAQWGPVPLPGARQDIAGSYSVGEVNLKAILEAKRPEDNIRICPEDTITVPVAELIYVVGEVNKAGGFILNENETMSVIQAMALAGGMRGGASPKKAKILRAVNNESPKTEIPVDVAKILEGRARDLPMQAEDVLFIPSSAPKLAGLRAAEAAINIGTGIAIFRH